MKLQLTRNTILYVQYQELRPGPHEPGQEPETLGKYLNPVLLCILNFEKPKPHQSLYFIKREKFRFLNVFVVNCQQTDESIVQIAPGRCDQAIRKQGTLKSTFVLNLKKIKIIA